VEGGEGKQEGVGWGRCWLVHLNHVYDVMGKGKVCNGELAAWSVMNHHLNCLFRIQVQITETTIKECLYPALSTLVMPILSPSWFTLLYLC